MSIPTKNGKQSASRAPKVTDTTKSETASKTKPQDVTTTKEPHSPHLVEEAENVVKKRKPSLQKKLEDEVRILTGKSPQAMTSSEWESLCEQYSLQALCPGEYVAFRDHFEHDKKGSRLIWREVICNSPSLVQVQRVVGELLPTELAEIIMDYITPAEQQKTQR